MAKKEYIERGAAVDELRRRNKTIGELIAMKCDSDLLKKVLSIYNNAREEAAMLIEKIPAADVVEVVRCKDCMIGFRKFVNGKEVIECQRHQYEDPRQYKKIDDYCSYGERKDVKTYTLAEVKTELGLDQMDGGKHETD